MAVCCKAGIILVNLGMHATGLHAKAGHGCAGAHAHLPCMRHLREPLQACSMRAKVHHGRTKAHAHKAVSAKQATSTSQGRHAPGLCAKAGHGCTNPHDRQAIFCIARDISENHCKSVA